MNALRRGMAAAGHCNRSLLRSIQHYELSPGGLFGLGNAVGFGQGVVARDEVGVAVGEQDVAPALGIRAAKLVGGVREIHAALVVADGKQVAAVPAGRPGFAVAVVALGVVLLIDPQLLSGAAALSDLPDARRVRRSIVYPPT